MGAQVAVEQKRVRSAVPSSGAGWMIWGGLIVAALAVFPFVLSAFTGEPVDAGAPKFWQFLLAQVFIWAVFAMSYDLLMGYTGILSFGHAMFFGTGAYVTSILLLHANWPLWQVVIAVLVVSVLQSLLIGLVSLRVKGVYLTMVTLAFSQMFFILSEATDFRQWTGAEDGLHSVPVPEWMSPTDQRLRFYYIALAFGVLAFIILKRVVDSPTGKVMLAIRENETRAGMIGYNTFRFKLVAVTIAGVLAGLAGMMNALLNTSVTSNLFRADTTINALLMTIIGGVGTLVGPILGAGVIQILGYWLNTLTPSWPLIFGVIFILIVLFFPYGLVGTWQMRASKGRASRLRHILQSQIKPE